MRPPNAAARNCASKIRRIVARWANDIRNVLRSDFVARGFVIHEIAIVEHCRARGELSHPDRLFHSHREPPDSWSIGAAVALPASFPPYPALCRGGCRARMRAEGGRARKTSRVAT